MSDTPNTIAGERYAETPPARISRRHSVIGIGVVAAVVAGFFAFRGGGQDHKVNAVTEEPTRISSVLNFEPVKEQPIPKSLPQSENKLKDQLAKEDTPIVDTTLDKARATPLVRRPAGQPAPQQSPVIAQSDRERAPQPQQAESELAGKLHSTVLTGSKAAVLPNPEMTVTMGTLIPCTLQTAMDSSAPGIVTCVTQADVLSVTGDVVLMDRGTKIVGEYSSRMAQGQNRMFVLWNRAETPKHVVITLGSPAADALGRAGFDGHIDTNFWQRFGSAMLITMINGAFSMAGQLASKEGSTSFNLGSGESVATEALRSSVNIPPVLRKNQGETVAVMVARDLSFADVYGLSVRSR